VAGIAESVNDKLKEFKERSKRFNNQENLFEREITDYTRVDQMAKEFLPYANLWITSRNWF
jgi:dynein heavy chain